MGQVILTTPVVLNISGYCAVEMIEICHFNHNFELEGRYCKTKMNNEIQHSHEVIIIKSVRFSAIIDVNNQPSKNYWNLMV